MKLFPTLITAAVLVCCTAIASADDELSFAGMSRRQPTALAAGPSLEFQGMRRSCPAATTQAEVSFVGMARRQPTPCVNGKCSVPAAAKPTPAQVTTAPVPANVPAHGGCIMTPQGMQCFSGTRTVQPAKPRGLLFRRRS